MNERLFPAWLMMSFWKAEKWNRIKFAMGGWYWPIPTWIELLDHLWLIMIITSKMANRRAATGLKSFPLKCFASFRIPHVSASNLHFHSVQCGCGCIQMKVGCLVNSSWGSKNNRQKYGQNGILELVGYILIACYLNSCINMRVFVWLFKKKVRNSE